MKHFSIITVILALAIIAALPASAQFGGDRRGEGGPDGGPPQEHGDPFQQALAQDFQARLDQLKEALKITPEQEPLWQAYEDKVRALMTDMNAPPGAPPENQDALQKIDRQVDTARDRLTAMEDIALAAKALYSKLTPEQKTLADQRLAGTLPQLYPAGSEGGPFAGRMRGGFRSRPPPQSQ